MVIRGNSMAPYLKDGDEVVVDTNQIPKVGNLVLCKLDGELIVHRLLPNGLVKGDNNLFYDWNVVGEHKILGVVSQRKMGQNFQLVESGRLHYFLAFLCQENHHKNSFRKFYRLLLIVFGSIARVRDTFF